MHTSLCTHSCVIVYTFLYTSLQAITCATHMHTCTVHIHKHPPPPTLNHATPTQHNTSHHQPIPPPLHPLNTHTLLSTHHLPPLYTSQLKRVQTKGLHLIGFRPITDLQPWHQIRSSYFVYPNEKYRPGSTAAFVALYKQLGRKRRMAVCSYVWCWGWRCWAVDDDGDDWGRSLRLLSPLQGTLRTTTHPPYPSLNHTHPSLTHTG